MDEGHKRYRAFISYSQREKGVARRLHRALETYRVPKGIDAPVAPDRRLGRFFRDDDEMGASQSLGAALEGALDDSENLIVICSPSAAQSKWVDAEVRHFKSRGDAGVFAVIVAGEPNAKDPSNECFPPALKVKIGAGGVATSEPDEPRAPELRHDGMQKVRAQLAAGLLGIPFDDLWRRDRRRARRTKLLVAAASIFIVAVIGVAGLGWLDAKTAARQKAADQAIGLARSGSAEGRVGEALSRLAPYLEYPATRQMVEGPLRTLLGWIPDPAAQLSANGIQPVRLRDAVALLDRTQGVYDISDIGLKLDRLIRSRDGKRLIAIGDQRVAVIDADNGERLGQVDNESVVWLGYAFESPSGLIFIAGAVLGPTNGSVLPYVLTISNDGRTVERVGIDAHAFWGSAVGVSPSCEAFLLAVEGDRRQWQVLSFPLTENRALDPIGLAVFRAADDSDDSGIKGLGGFGSAFQTQDAFLGFATTNPFTAAGCLSVGSEEGFTPGSLALQGVRTVNLDVSPGVEPVDQWRSEEPVRHQDAENTYLPDCTEARPCPIVGGRTELTYIRDDLPRTADDQVGSPPPPRWSRPETSIGAGSAPIYLEHLVFNSGHQMTVCRPWDDGDACLEVSVMGEDTNQLPVLRSADGRYLFWPFGGSVFDLQSLQPLVPERGIPRVDGLWADFEIDRPGLTVVAEGRLVTYLPSAEDGPWTRVDDERASPYFDILASDNPGSSLHTIASLGGRQYLAVRSDGTLARLDAATGRQIWRLNANGLGKITDVQLNPEREHVLLIGSGAWRLFGLSDGYPMSAFLVPPPAIDEPEKLVECKLDGVIGPAGQVTAGCADRSFVWRPKAFEGEMVPQLALINCAATFKTSALDTIRRCYVDH